MDKPVKDIRFAFSRLTAFEQCPMMFYLENIKNPPVEEVDNFFAQYGTFAHLLLEGWAKDEIPSYALAEEWEDGFDAAVTMPPPPFPKGMAEKYYQAGLKYFKSFNGFGDEYEILSVEEKFVLNIDGYQVSGIADLILRNKRTGDIEVIDHKSKSMSTMKKDLPTYTRQLYLYAMAVKEKWGVYPAKLKFNVFKEGKFVTEDFTMEGMNETRQWILDTIHRIEQTTEWCIHTDSYFCKNICSCAFACDGYNAVVQADLEKWRKKKEAEEDVCPI